MDPTKEKLLHDTYEKVIGIGFGSEPIDDLDKYFSENLMLVGTTADEMYNTLSEIRLLIERQREQSKGMILEFFRTPVYRANLANENVVILVEKIVLKLTVDAETVQFSLRNSAVLEFKDDQWKLIHWHASKPEEVTSHEDTFGIKDWQAKTEKLEKLIAERTAELVIKNHELEIETCLERVRAVAMGMNIPADMLQVCRVISAQFELLGIKNIRNVQTVIIYKEKFEYLNYQYFTPYKKDAIESIDYRLHPDVLEFTEKMLSSDDAYYTKAFSGEELETWREYRKQTNQIPDPKLDESLSVHYYFYSIGSGALGLTTYSPLTEAQILLLKKFRNVFQLAYRRFIDIREAEAQAREAIIESALEKVRSSSLAMHTSDELGKVVTQLLSNLHELGFRSETGSAAHIIIFSKNSKDFEQWSADPFLDKPVKASIPYKEIPMLSDLFKAKEAGLNLFIKNYSLEEKNEFFTYAFEYSDLKHLPEELKHLLLASKTYANWTAIEDNSAITVNSISGNQLTDDQTAILKRFAKVFEQAYIRFLDLQKAEAQNREAKIELALERVRAKTMAMQQSHELKEVIQVVYEQFVQLNILVEHAGFIIDYKQKEDMNIWLADKQKVPFQVSIPYFDCAHWNSFNEAKKNGNHFFANHLGLEEKNKFYRDLFELIPGVPDETKEYYTNCPGVAISTVLLDNVGLYIENFSAIPYSDEENNILMRFGMVFQQTYTRFLDLQKAEAQARDAQIELALERVRSKAMAMQTSENLAGAVTVVFEELEKLTPGTLRCGIGIIDKEKKTGNIWTTVRSGKGSIAQVSGDESMDLHPLLQKAFEAWLKQEDYDYELSGKDLTAFYKATAGTFELPVSQSLASKSNGNKQYYHLASFQAGGLYAFRETPFPEEAKTVMKRFADVFSLTYTRFLDLQKTEAQAREARIEVSLERVRSRAMAMHSTEELLDAAELVSKELAGLGIESMNVSYAFVDKEEKFGSYYSLNPVDGKIPPFPFVFPHTETEVMRDILSSWKKQETFNVLELDEQATLKHQTWVGEHILNLIRARNINIPFSVEDFLAISPKKAVIYTFNFRNGYLFKIGSEKLTKDQEELMLRFTRVFEMTYQRFLDLQKAEEQTRESKIELGLERVRARAMAMQKSEELNGLVGTVFRELTKLDILPTRCVIMIYGGQSNESKWWMANSEDPDNPGSFTVQAHNYPPINAYFEAWRNRRHKWTYVLEGKIKKDWDDFLFSETELASLPAAVIEGMKKPDCVYLNASFNNFGNLTLASVSPLNDDEFDILLRFAKVFDHTYTRFNDLQKAEAQANEARIEASLERIRAKAMAMHRSEEIDEVLEVLFDQFDVLGIVPMSTHLTLIDVPSNTFTFRETGKGGRKSFGEQKVAIDSMDIWKEAADKWKAMEPLSLNRLHFPKESLPVVWQVFHESFASMPEGHKITPDDYPDGIYHTAGNCQFGYIGMNQVRKATEEEEQIVLKFAVEFGRLYQRYLDLQKAEAQTREANIEASLERVRSKAMAMHSSQDLADTIVAFYHELQNFSITPRRCGVGLINRESRIAELSTMNSTADGNSLEIIGTLKMAGHPVLEGVYDNWLLQKEYHPVLTGPEIPEYYKMLRPQIEFPEFPEDAVQFGYFFFFPEGGVYAWTEKQMGEDELIIYRRFTSVLSLTYKRYKDLQQAEDLARQAEEDLIKLKVEKTRTEEALTELKAAQAQLIQSEKMASLGELTAGVAHEIQNPLNFVNNFSDLSSELLDEMSEQLSAGNFEEAKEIAEGVKQNLEKILHHGKRADGIVKGMLQHSRTGTGQKEPTDLNALADEYLRLAFHGLRAKDKSFNASFETDFDESIGKVDVIPQDMGRVLVNLLNNAFYAVNEKRTKAGNGYEPLVSVSSKKYENKIEVRVTDNGNGIPQYVVEKIFQPFFTTKPTGQGTGLGLSLSYDIIKAHGGELKVETTEGNGSAFIIYIPA